MSSYNSQDNYPTFQEQLQHLQSLETYGYNDHFARVNAQQAKTIQQHQDWALQRANGVLAMYEYLHPKAHQQSQSILPPPRQPEPIQEVLPPPHIITSTEQVITPNPQSDNVAIDKNYIAGVMIFNLILLGLVIGYFMLCRYIRKKEGKPIKGVKLYVLILLFIPALFIFMVLGGNLISLANLFDTNNLVKEVIPVYILALAVYFYQCGKYLFK